MTADAGGCRAYPGVGGGGAGYRGEAEPRKIRLWFSGDIGRRDLPLLRDPVLPEGADYMIMECTYGDKPHDDPQLAYEELREVVGRTIERGGKVIIPAFAVGRTQELVYDLHRMIDGGEMPRIPVFVDSPLAVNASDVFKAAPGVLRRGDAGSSSQQDRHQTALGFDQLTYTRSVEESKALNDRERADDDHLGFGDGGERAHPAPPEEQYREPAQYDADRFVAGAVHAWDGGWRTGRSEVSIFGETYEVRAEVATIGGFSAHAGQTMLVEYAQAAQETVKQIYLVHGEPKAAEALMGKLAEAGMRNVGIRRWGGK